MATNQGLTFKDLRRASSDGDGEVVRQCLNSGVDQNEHPGMPREASPLMLASRNGHLQIVRLLLEDGSNINFSDGDGFTALTLACEYRCWDVVQLLAEYGADFTINNATGRDGHAYLQPSYCRSKRIRNTILDIVANNKGAQVDS